MTASPTSSPPRTCPSCGARNSSISLFCAECGASLNGGDDVSSTSSYGSFAPDGGSQETAAFTPATAAPAEPDATRASRPVTSTVQPFSPSWEQAAPAATVASDPWQAEPVTYPQYPATASGGMRGFFLGLLAVLLIVAVLGAWLWAGILDASTRDSIGDFFSFLDFRG